MIPPSREQTSRHWFHIFQEGGGGHCQRQTADYIFADYKSLSSPWSKCDAGSPQLTWIIGNDVWCYYSEAVLGCGAIKKYISMSKISEQMTWARNANKLLIWKRCVMYSCSSKLSDDVLHNNLLCGKNKTKQQSQDLVKWSLCAEESSIGAINLNVCGFFRPKNLFFNKCPMWRDVPHCEKLQNKAKHLKIRVNSACHYPRPAPVCFSRAIKSAGRN